MLAHRSASDSDLRTASAHGPDEEALGSSLGNATDRGFPTAQATRRELLPWDLAARSGIHVPDVGLATASVHAEAWRRVARDLPLHLKDGGEPALVARTRHWNETVIREPGVSASVVESVNAPAHRMARAGYRIDG